MLAEHLDQIRQAARAIWGRHGRTLFAANTETCQWFDDAVTLHDAGKASAAFQEYIPNPAKYRGSKESKAHTPLSTMCALRYAQDQEWAWQRALAVALIAAGHHSEFKTHDELDRAFSSMDHVIDQQIQNLDWDALDRAIGISVPRPNKLTGTELCVEASDFLQELVEPLHEFDIEDQVAYRLRCQLAFSVLLEADKAFLAVPPKDLPKYLAPRQSCLPPEMVEKFLIGKPATAMNPIRTQARQAMFTGLESAGEQRLQTMTLPTGTGKTLLAASWALTLREKINAAEGQPPLVLIVLPFLAIIDQTAKEYEELFRGYVEAGELISYHSLSDRTYAPDLEDNSQGFFLDTWQSNVVITTFDQFLFALLSPKAKHQMRFHHLADALIVLDEVQALPCILWEPLRRVLGELTKLGSTRLLAMSATQPGFLNNPHELIGKCQDFFQQMARYRIVLRHQVPMKLESFIQECRSRLPEWAGRRVLITLNTRRSARQVRDELALNLPAGMALEFLSADVAPKDRLRAISRIKERVQNSEPCLVVSTQCVEAGVDIDMDLVIRDFGPLDSIIQIAGRCNRHNLRSRGRVEIACLVDDESGRSFAGMIYDKILLHVTQQTLGGRETLDEEEIFPLTADYFTRLAKEKNTGEEEIQHWGRWEEMTAVRKLLRGVQPPQVSFLVIQNDPGYGTNWRRPGRFRTVGVGVTPCGSWHAGLPRTPSRSSKGKICTRANTLIHFPQIRHLARNGFGCCAMAIIPGNGALTWGEEKEIKNRGECVYESGRSGDCPAGLGSR
jgi:CRISPR-associated endonuclease/helicase Cas3